MDGLYDMKDRCLEALGDKTPFGVQAGKVADGFYGLTIKVWLIHQKTIYDLWFYVIFNKFRNLTIIKNPNTILSSLIYKLILSIILKL